jgi:hypothetical protein
MPLMRRPVRMRVIVPVMVLTCLRMLVAVLMLMFMRIDHPPIRLADAPVGQVRVVVMVLVDGQCRRGAGAEQL